MGGFPDGSAGNNLPAMQQMRKMLVLSLGQEDPLEKEMATHSSILAWRIPWTEESGRLRSIALDTTAWLSTQHRENLKKYLCIW